MKKLNKRSIAIITILLIVYFVFCSGFVFEVTKSEATDKVSMPYSIPFSAERTGIAGIYTQSDVDCVKWYVEHGNKDLKFVGDCNGRRLAISFISEIPHLRDNFVNPAPNYDSIPDHCYIFVTDWNYRNQKYVKHGGIGLRFIRELPVFQTYGESNKASLRLDYLDTDNYADFDLHIGQDFVWITEVFRSDNSIVYER